MTLSAGGCPTEQRLRVQAHGDGIDDWPPACALNPAPPNRPDAQIAQQQTPSAVAALFLFAQTLAPCHRAVRSGDSVTAPAQFPCCARAGACHIPGTAHRHTPRSYPNSADFCTADDLFALTTTPLTPISAQRKSRSKAACVIRSRLHPL
jgi:hypothetical protein